MEISLLDSMLSLMFLLGVSGIIFIISKKINFPYTVCLVVVGIILAFLESHNYIGFIRNFSLTPEMLFYIFLPVLIFESAYNFNYKDLFKSGPSIFSLSVIGVIISALSISGLLYFLLPFIGFKVPYLICLLYGSLISATDTVAVLSLFKSIGAPKRLVTIFEGESLFNDGTALALFLVILGIVSSGNSINFSSISEGILSFLTMFIGGFIFGGITGVLFSKIISFIKNNESVEITLTMILAHLTFILSEVISEFVYIGNFDVKISGAIATTVAAIIMGNYGRYKISPKVGEYMEKFWGFFAFIANSLVFILLGLIISDIKVDLFSGAILIVVIVILVGIISRAISIYLPIGIVNKLKIERHIPYSWQHVLAWGSPRGALALMMLLLVPSDLEITGWELSFSVRDFLTLITIGTIMFTLFIKVPTVGILIKKLKLNKLNRLEKLEKEQSIIMITNKNIELLDSSFHKLSIDKKHYQKVKNSFEKLLQVSIENIKKISLEDESIIDRMLSLYSLGMQKIFLIELLTYNEIDEKNFKYLLNRIEEKSTNLEYGIDKIINLEDNYKENFLEKINNMFIKGKPNDFFLRTRSQRIVIWKVIQELKEIREINFGFSKEHFDKIIEIYEEFFELLPRVNIKNEDSIKLENSLFEKGILKSSENTINELKTKGILTTKLYNVLIERIDSVINK